MCVRTNMRFQHFSSRRIFSACSRKDGRETNAFPYLTYDLRAFANRFFFRFSFLRKKQPCSLRAAYIISPVPFLPRGTLHYSMLPFRKKSSFVLVYLQRAQQSQSTIYVAQFCLSYLDIADDEKRTIFRLLFIFRPFFALQTEEGEDKEICTGCCPFSAAAAGGGGGG